MHLPTLRRRREIQARLDIPVQTPRDSALEWATAKIERREAGLDPYDLTLLIVDAAVNETKWAECACSLVGLILDRRDRSDGTVRFKVLLEAGLDRRLGLSPAEGPFAVDEPLASRSLASTHGETDPPLIPFAGLRLLEAPDEPMPVPAMREQMLRAQHAAALRVDCACGAPAGLECRCSDPARLASPVWDDDGEAQTATSSRELREQRWLDRQPERQVH